ncbi:MAG TPA: glycosyltransferase [Chthoniobacterales bacterium]
MPSNPLLSICIPAYQAERYLPDTLESVRNQAYGNWELIVVEDGSNDATESIVNTFTNTVAQAVRFVRHEQNRGLPATRNTGVSLARGDWIVLLDSDDLWTPSHLTDLAASAQREVSELVHSGSILFESGTGRELEIRAPSAEIRREFPLSLFQGQYIIQPSSVMLHKSLWSRVGGFDPAFRYVEDREMWMRCARAGAAFAFTGNNTCLYRKHSSALSTHSAEMAEASAQVFDRHLDWEAIPSSIRRRRASEAWAAAGKLRQKRDPLRAADHFIRACGVQWRTEWWLRSVLCRLASLLPIQTIRRQTL